MAGAWLCIFELQFRAWFFTKVLSPLHRADSHSDFDESGLGRDPAPTQSTWIVQAWTGLACIPQREKKALFG